MLSNCAGNTSTTLESHVIKKGMQKNLQIAVQFGVGAILLRKWKTTWKLLWGLGPNQVAGI